MERLMNKICNNFLTQFENKLDARLQKFEEKLTQVCESIKTLSAGIENNTKKIVELEVNFDSIAQNQKKNCVRICGLPESANESLIESIIVFMNEYLKINCSKNEIDYCFRVGSTTEENKPRIAIVNFLCNWKKSEVINTKKVLKGTPFSIFEDLTPKRYKILEQAKKKYGNNMVWSSGGKLFVWDSKKNKKVPLGNDIGNL